MRQLLIWLGPERARLIVTLLVGVGLGTLGLQLVAGGEQWAFTMQLALVWGLFLGLVLIIGTRLPQPGRQRFWLAVVPGTFLLGVGVLLPDYALFFGGGGLGWMIAAQFVLRGRVRMEYQSAVKHLRRNEFNEAVGVMNRLIEAEPDEAGHYRFRAELCRLGGRLPAAVADYERVIELAPGADAGYTGLAEVYAQQGKFAQAREYGLQALERAPHAWMVAYNLGLIEDRLGEAAAAVQHLEHALHVGISHRRYRLLAHLWLARNYKRQGQTAEADDHLASMRRFEAGVQDWTLIMNSDQAAPLRNLLRSDVVLAQRLLAGQASLDV